MKQILRDVFKLLLIMCLLLVGTNIKPTWGDDTFIPHPIDQGQNVDSVEFTDPVDFDGDGDLDVVVADGKSVGDTGAFLWYENISNGSRFQVHVIDNDQANVNSANTIKATDINNDGKMDVVTASGQGLGSEGTEQFAWYEQTSDSVTFSRHIIGAHTRTQGAEFIFPVDMDGDGDPDVVTANHDLNVGEFAWYENSTPTTDTWPRNIIINLEFDTPSLNTSTGTPAKFPRIIRPADMDGDGDTDVVAAAQSRPAEIAWYEHLSGGLFKRHIIQSGFPVTDPRSIHPVDVDGDGNMDVVTATHDGVDSEISWYEQTGDSVTFRRHVIATGDTVEDVFEVRPVDFDDDGDIDILSSAQVGFEFAWYEQTSDSVTFDRNLINGSYTGNRTIASGDVDGDGVIDVITTGTNPNFDYELTWHERNFLPTINPLISDQMAMEDGPAWEISLSTNANDTDGDLLKWQIIDGADTLVTSKLANGTYMTGGGDTLTLIPNNDANGTSTITIALGDGHGTDTQKFQVFLTNVNDTPLLSALSNLRGFEDQEPFTVPLGSKVSDTENDPLKWSVKGETSIVQVSFTRGGYVTGGDDTLVLTPVKNASGKDTFTLKVGDGMDTTFQVLTVTLKPEFEEKVTSTDTQIAADTTNVTLTDREVSPDTTNNFSVVAMDSAGFSENITSNPTAQATSDSKDRSTRNYRFKLPLVKAGQDTLTIDIWTNQHPFKLLYGLRSDTTTVDTGNLPSKLTHNDTGLGAFGRTAFLLEFADSDNRLLGSDTVTTNISDSFAYVLEYNLSEETTRLFNEIGFDTSAGSDDFQFNFADTFAATWQSDTSTVAVDTNVRGGITVRVAVLGKDLPGSLGGQTAPESVTPGDGEGGGGGGGGGGCIIERSNAPRWLENSLRNLRDWMMKTSVGRLFTKLYY